MSTDWAGAAQAGQPRPWPVRLFAPVWRHAFVTPVSSGRLRGHGWPSGLQFAVAISLVGYLGLGLLVIASGVVQRLAPASLTLDIHPVGLLGTLGAFWLASFCLVAAARQARGWRWPLLGVALVIGGVLSAQLFGLVAAWPLTSVVLGVLGLVWVAVLVVALAGSRRVGSIRRHYLLLGLVGVATLAPVLVQTVLFALGGSRGLADAEFALTGIYGALLVILVITLPVAYAAGASFVQITLSVAAWAAIGSAEMLGRRARAGLPVLCAVLLVGNVVAVIFDESSLQSWTHSAVIALVAGLASWWWLRRARLRGPVERPTPTTMGEHLASSALLLGVVFSVWYPIRMVMGWLIVADISPNAVAFALGAVAALLLAERCARRGQSAGAAVFAPVSVACATMAVYNYLPTQYGYGLAHRELSAIAAAGVLVMVGVHLVRRTLSQQVWLLTAIGLLACLLLPWREPIAEPLAALFGFSAVGVLFFGLIWRVLTEADWANHESAGLPRTSRVLIFCAHALLAAGATVALAYSADRELLHLDLDFYATIGGRVLGFAVPVAVVVGLTEMARYRLDPSAALASNSG